MLLSRFFPATFGVGIGFANFAAGLVDGERPSATIALATTVGVLGGGIIWFLKQVIQKTIPDMNARHAAEMNKVCTTFQACSRRDRRLSLKAHRELGERMQANHEQIMQELKGEVEREVDSSQ